MEGPRARHLSVALAVTVCACTSVTIDRNTNGDPQPPVVTLSARGAEPQQLHLYDDEGITFINSDSRAHQIRVDAVRSTHPGCAAIGVGALEPGERRTSALLPGVALCWYTDATDPADPRWQGVVVTH